MQFHQVQPKHKRQKAKRVGRGGKKGTYSGRGMKGQNARAGRNLAPMVREVLKRYPKLKGYRIRGQKNAVAVSLDTLEKRFAAEELVSPEVLVEKKIVRTKRGKIPAITITSQGTLTKPLIIERCRLTLQAKTKIEKAGGKMP